MINFRYHLVSLAAVLLALAAGVVLGAGPLQEKIGDRGSSSSDQDQIASLQAQVGDLQKRVSYDDAVATALAPVVLPDRLKGKSVVVVVAPDTDRAQVQQLTEAVRTAGGTVTGEVDIQPAWVDPKQATVLGTLADQLGPEEAAPSTAGPYARAGAALSTALVTDAKTPSSKADEDAVAILTGFEQGGFITVRGDPAVRAQLALVAAPAAPVGGGDAAVASAEALLPLVAALDAGQGAVVAGAEGSVAKGGLVAAVRASGTVRRAVSSDDVADIPSGVLGSVLALAEQAAGTTGQYGVGPGADAALPEIAPIQ